MPDSEDEGHHSKRHKLKGLLKGLSKGKDELLKGKHVLENSLGLGQKPFVIPPGEAIVDGQLRKVEIGWHPVLGLGGKWFAEKTGLGKMITEKVKKYPDPTQHWAVLCGEFVHQLWMDEHLHVIYLNEKIDREEWHIFEVGQTRFNDQALQHAGQTVIQTMREKQESYNLITNNCQVFTQLLLDTIQIGPSHLYGTTQEIWKRMFGPGRVNDLFAGGEAQGQLDPEKPELHHQNTVQFAQQVMEENTNAVDNHYAFH